MMQRRAMNRDQEEEEGEEDDTKLVDYYLLKVLEMSDQRTQQKKKKRENTGGGGQQKKRLIRPSPLVDPRAVRELLQLSLKLHVPPQDLIDMLVTEEIRKLHRRPPHPPDAAAALQHYSRTGGGGQAPKIRYYSRRLPAAKSKSLPEEDVDREDFLDIIGVETISSEYPVTRPRPASSPARGGVAVAAAAPPAKPAPAKIPIITSPAATGRRENLFLSELNKMPLRRRQTDDDDEDEDVEDEVTTYLAAKILTEYPAAINKRDTRHNGGQFPYELYEQAVKDYLDQADTGDTKSPLAKRESASAAAAAQEEEEEGVEPSTAETQQQVKDEIVAETAAPVQTEEDDGEAGYRGKPVAGM